MITNVEVSRIFDEIADLYDNEVDVAIKRLTTALEPLVLLISATVIGFIAVSLVSSVMKAVSTFN